MVEADIIIMGAIMQKVVMDIMAEIENTIQIIIRGIIQKMKQLIRNGGSFGREEVAVSYWLLASSFQQLAVWRFEVRFTILDLRIKMFEVGCQIQDLRIKMWCQWFEIGCKMKDAGYKMQYTGSRGKPQRGDMLIEKS